MNWKELAEMDCKEAADWFWHRWEHRNGEPTEELLSRLIAAKERAAKIEELNWHHRRIVESSPYPRGGMVDINDVARELRRRIAELEQEDSK